MRIAIQGGKASFHDLVARQYFPGHELALVECRTFRQQCTYLQAGQVDFVVMAIENSLAGGILPNYTLLQRFPFTIVGERYLHVKQNLMALPGQTITDIKIVRSHPMALHQCNEFLEQHPHICGEESHDTADSAREIREKGLRGVAAIAAESAAELYDLNILAASIENIKNNYTRFLVLSKEKQVVSPDANKASVCFHVQHKVGALANVLDVFRDQSLNLGLIQSIPIPGHPDEYAFHVDLRWLKRENYELAIAKVRQLTRELTILGEYQCGDKPYDRF